MKPGGGHGKGAGFERDICRWLSNWISGGERDDVFWRSSNSGGRATVAMRKGGQAEYSSSDIAPTHKLAYDLLEVFTIECKFYGDLHLQDLPFDRKSNISQFWAQACSDAIRVDKNPILIAKQNRRPPLVGWSMRVFQAAVALNPVEVSFVHASRYNLVLLDMEEAFKILTPELLPAIALTLAHPVIMRRSVR